MTHPEGALSSWAVLTPARDEAERLRRVAESLARQTVPPALWLVLENGSQDDTVAVAKELEREFPWARLQQVDLPRAAPSRGGPVVRALHAGLEGLSREYGVVMKVDSDVTLDPSYIERLADEFRKDDTLGVASGTCYEEEEDGQWVQRHMTANMVWCAARAYRRECLDRILPFTESFGWDGVDIAKAQLRGWRTHLFTDLPFQHHRGEGERDGLPTAAWKNQGRGSYFLGYRPSYMLFRALNGMRRDPRAVMALWGYVSAALSGHPRYEEADVRERIRETQRLRFLRQRVKEASGRR